MQTTEIKKTTEPPAANKKRSANFAYRFLMLKIDPRCWYCRKALTLDDSTLDHVVPRCNGGKRVNNTVLACSDCNLAKGNKPGVVTDDILTLHKKLRSLRKKLQAENRQHAHAANVTVKIDKAASKKTQDAAAMLIRTIIPDGVFKVGTALTISPLGVGGPIVAAGPLIARQRARKKRKRRLKRQRQRLKTEAYVRERGRIEYDPDADD